jgi:hypothetical protein
VFISLVDNIPRHRCRAFDSRYSLEIFEEPDLRIATKLLNDGSTSWWRIFLKMLLSPAFRAARKTFFGHRKDPAKTKDLGGEATEACRILDGWLGTEPESVTPFLPRETDACTLAIRQLEEDIHQIEDLLPHLEYA